MGEVLWPNLPSSVPCVLPPGKEEGRCRVPQAPCAALREDVVCVAPGGQGRSCALSRSGGSTLGKFPPQVLPSLFNIRMSQVPPGLNIVKVFVLQHGYKSCRDGAGR